MRIGDGWRLLGGAVSGWGWWRQSHEGARIASTSRGARTAGHSRARVDVDWSTRNIEPLSTVQPRPLSEPLHSHLLFTFAPALRCNVSQLCINWSVSAYRLKNCETIQVKFKNTLATSVEWRDSRCARAASSTTSGGTRVAQVSILYVLSIRFRFTTHYLKIWMAGGVINTNQADRSGRSI